MTESMMFGILMLMIGIFFLMLAICFAIIMKRLHKVFMLISIYRSGKYFIRQIERFLA